MAFLKRHWMGVLCALLVVGYVGWFLAVGLIFSKEDLPKNAAEWGSAYGPPAGLITAVALVFAAYTLLTQREELQAQRDELALQRRELESQTGAMKAQEQALSQSADEFRKHTEFMEKQIVALNKANEASAELGTQFKRVADRQDSLAEEAVERVKRDKRNDLLRNLRSKIGETELLQRQCRWALSMLSDRDHSGRRSNLDHTESLLKLAHQWLLESIDSLLANDTLDSIEQRQFEHHLRELRSAHRTIQNGNGEDTSGELDVRGIPETKDRIAELRALQRGIEVTIEECELNRSSRSNIFVMESDVRVLKESMEEIQAEIDAQLQKMCPTEEVELGQVLEARRRVQRGLQQLREQGSDSEDEPGPEAPLAKDKPAQIELCNEVLQEIGELSKELEGLFRDSRVAQVVPPAEQQSILYKIAATSHRLMRVLDALNLRDSNGTNPIMELRQALNNRREWIERRDGIMHTLRAQAIQ